jgi:hypothetical protein
MERPGLALNNPRGSFNRISSFGSPQYPLMGKREEIRFSCIHCGEHLRYIVGDDYERELYPDTDYYIKKLTDMYNSTIDMV